jgi:hypothetical protein
MQYYELAIIIVIPASVCVVINTIIFKYVKSSSRRIQPSAHSMTENNDQPAKFSRRDVHLLRHMVIMFFVFVVGWGPIYITAVVMNYVAVSIFTLSVLSLLAAISLVCDMVDLFLYSNELREYLQRTLLPCYYN